MGSITELEHTADVGFELRATELAELFELAAEGLARARGAEADPGATPETERIELARPDLERLLVAWLRELLYRAMRDDTVPSARVEEVRPPGGESEARLAAGVEWRPAADGPAREIKGVTYHGLDVRRREDGRWHARVVLDV